MTTNPTCALVLVGTELIAGDIADTNRHFITSNLWQIGVRVVGVHIIGDELQQIADLLRHLSSRVAYVITVGGLGPTVDDLTLPSVAQAFGLSTVTRQADTPATYAQMSGSETTQPMLRAFPLGSELISTPGGPLVRTHNVYSLPGLPRLVRTRLPTLLRRLSGSVIHRRTLSFLLPQSQVAHHLDEAIRQHPAVLIGCYPSGEDDSTTLVSFEGSDSEEVDSCLLLVKKSVAPTLDL